VIRSTPEDFRVDEVLGFRPDGEGEHVLLRIEKRNTNTAWLADQLARLADVPSRDVSYAGLKDRHAVTRQWFSVRLAGRPEPEWEKIESEEAHLLEYGRHRRKLKRGALKANRFQILIRELDGEREELESRLHRIKEQGVPNFFGEQRFGHDEGNLLMASRLFGGERMKLSRNKRGIYLSAARSYLFNQVLAERIRNENWDRALTGDLMMLDGSRAIFPVAEPDDEISERLQRLDIHPTGPLYGTGDSGTASDCETLERRVLESQNSWREGLERSGMRAERRALRIRVADLSWDWREQSGLQLQFQLPPGSYATALLRELVHCSTGKSQ
jgi:tRNA pseudouridine13 synthase